MADAPPPPVPETVRVYDDAGQALDLPQAEAEAALRRGEVGFKADQEVVLRDGDGKLRALSGAEAAQALQSYQISLGTAGGLQEQQLQEEYGGVVQGIRAGAAGAARAATFGGSDVLLSELGMREDLANLQRYRPGASMAGEGAVLLGSALATGGGSLAARGVTALPRALMRGGQVAERIGARALVGAGAEAGGVVARAGSLALGQAVEMGAFSAGQEVSRAALANEDLSGERLYAAFGHGALLGAGFGAGFGAAGAVASRAATATKEAALRAGDRVLEVGERAITGARELGERALGKGGELAPVVGDKAKALAERLAPGGVDKFYAQKMLQSTGANQPLVGKLRAMGESAEARAIKQIEELPTYLGKERGAIISHAEAAEAAQKSVEKWGSQIGDSLSALDAAGTAIKPNVEAIVMEARTGLVADLLSSPFTRRQGQELNALVKDIADSLPAPSFSELHKQRRLLDQRIRFEAKTPTIGQEALRDLRNIIEREIERSAEAASKEIGADFAATYKAAKEQYGVAKWTEEATELGAKRGIANQSIGLREIVGSVGGSSVGAAVGGAVAGPLGAAVGGTVGGVASAYLNNLSKRYGDQVVTAVIRRLGAGATPAEVAVSVMDEVVGKSVATYLRKGAGKAAETARAGLRNVAEAAEDARGQIASARKANRAPSTSMASALSRRTAEGAGLVAEEYRRTRDAVAAAAAASDRTARLHAELPPGTSPRAAAVASATAARAIAYLQRVAPQAPAQGRTLTPAAAGRLALPSPLEQERYLRQARAVADPMSLLEDLARGDVSPDVVEAIQDVYPEWFSSVQLRVQAELSTRTDELDYEQEAAISRLFGIVGHPSFDPKFMARQQVVFRTAAPPQQPPPPRAPAPVAHLYDLDHKEYPR